MESERKRTIELAHKSQYTYAKITLTETSPLLNSTIFHQSKQQKYTCCMCEKSPSQYHTAQTHTRVQPRTNASSIIVMEIMRTYDWFSCFGHDAGKRIANSSLKKRLARECTNIWLGEPFKRQPARIHLFTFGYTHVFIVLKFFGPTLRHNHSLCHSSRSPSVLLYGFVAHHASLRLTYTDAPFYPVLTAPIDLSFRSLLLFSSALVDIHFHSFRQWVSQLDLYRREREKNGRIIATLNRATYAHVSKKSAKWLLYTWLVFWSVRAIQNQSNLRVCSWLHRTELPIAPIVNDMRSRSSRHVIVKVQ